MANLTAAFVKTVKRPGTYGDGRGGHGLTLRVQTRADGGVAKSWTQRVRIGGRETTMGLGPFPVVTLREARAAALENARATFRGEDPRASRAVTFRQVAEAVIEAHRPTWKDGGRSAENWASSLERYAFPALGERPVGDITAGDILAIVGPLWSTRREAARKLLGRIRAVIAHAVAQNLRADDPCDAVRRALPKNGGTVEHHAAIPAAEVGQAIATVRASGAWWATKAAYAFIALTGVRSGETRLSTWAEVDMAAATWSIPGTRTKTGQSLRVALSRQALEILAEARERTGGEPDSWVFPSRTGRPLTSEALSKLARELNLGGNVHGLRSSLRSWLAEEAVPRDLAEQVLGHKVRGVEGAYQRSDLLARRREIAQNWSDFVLPA